MSIKETFKNYSKTQILNLDYLKSVDDLSDYDLALINRYANLNSYKPTRSVKGRGDVATRSAKPYRQKGTGRARQGSRNSPIFVGGGVAHATIKLNYKLKLNKRQRNVLLERYLKYLIENKEVFFFNSRSSTKDLSESIKTFAISYSSNISFVSNSSDLKKYFKLQGLLNLSNFSFILYKLSSVLSLEKSDIIFIDEQVFKKEEVSK